MLRYLSVLMQCYALKVTVLCLSKEEIILMACLSFYKPFVF